MKQVATRSFSPLLFFFLAALAYASFFPLGAGVFAWMASIQLVNSLAPKMPFSRPIHWLHAMTFEIFALLGVGLLRLIPGSRKTVQKKGRPILLVHGYINNGSVWLIFKKRLEALGFGPIYVINLGHPFRSIASYAEKVREKAKEIEKETNRSDLILIGHSMGGLVASYYATQMANTVTDVITIATPLQGTPVAHIALGPNGKEMRPKSLLLEKMREGMKNSSTTHFFHVATKSDQLVIPGESAIFKENPHFLLEDLGHASLLYSKRVNRQVAKWLKQIHSRDFCLVSDN